MLTPVNKVIDWHSVPRSHWLRWHNAYLLLSHWLCWHSVSIVITHWHRVGVNVDNADTVVIDYWDIRFLRITLRKQKNVHIRFCQSWEFSHSLICSDCSDQMSDCERLLRTNERLWANRSFLENRSFAHYLLTFSQKKQAIRLENPWANSGPLVFACSYRAKVECFVF